MAEVRVAGIDGERRAFKINIDSVEAVLGNNLSNGRNEVRNALWIGKREMLPAAAQRDHDLFAAAFQVCDIRLELCGIESGGRMELHRAFGRILIRRRESDDYDVPLRRYIAKREGGTSRAVTGPVSDEAVTIRRAARGNRRNSRPTGRSIGAARWARR